MGENNEIARYLNGWSAKGKFFENLIQEVTGMVGINIFGELVSAPSESKLLEVFIVDVDVDED